MTGPDPADRRVLRGVRNREAVVQAFLDIITEGDLSPTAQKVAERAGVSLRSVFHHFADMEELYTSAADLHLSRYIELVEPVPVDGPLAERIDAFVRQRTRLAERILPVFRASLLVIHRSPTIAQRLERGNRYLRHEVEATFATELQRTGELDGRLEVLDAICSLDGWLRLRLVQGLSVTRARTALTTALATLLA